MFRLVCAFVILQFSVCVISPVAFSARSEMGSPRVMQGPMIGLTTHDTIHIWLRLSANVDCQIEYDTEASFSNPKKSEAVTAQKENDYCVTVALQNLQPATRYYYRIITNGGNDPYIKNYFPLSCKTAPVPDAKTAFKIAFGSCARVQEDSVQPIWDVVSAHQPDLFFWLGDNVYADTTDPDILAEEYRRQREVTKLVPLLRGIPHLAVWDDHDYMLNDHDRTNPHKEEALHVFKQYWANMSYGLPDAPGVFFQYTYGGVDFFFVDSRYHRDPNEDEDIPQKTFLGKSQLNWLKDGLKKSTSPFKVIVSGSGWSVAKGSGGDAWSAYLHERNGLFDFIRDEHINGVVLLSGDTHVGELNCIPWSEHGDYDLYDLVSSPLAQSPGTDWTERRPEIRIRPVMASGPNVGFLEFDLSGEPKLTFSLYDIYFHRVWEPFTIEAKELQNGIQSWENKINPTEHKRLLNSKNGKGYYEP